MSETVVIAFGILAKFRTYTGHWNNHIWKFLRVSKIVEKLL